MSNKLGIYVPKLNTKYSSIAPAYTTFTIEVWNMVGSEKQLISTAELTCKVLSAEDRDKALDQVQQQTIEQILKYYGI